MASGDFGVDQQTRNLLEEKAKRRAVLREQFLKLRTDPFQHASGEGGAVFDKGYLRFQALRVSGTDYFKPTLKTVRIGVFYMILPITLYGYFLKKSREEKEAKLRRGEIAYRDRLFKFV